MEEEDFSILSFNSCTKFWIVRAEGGKYFDDFIADNYIGIRYNKVTINSLKTIQTNNKLPSVDTVKDIYRDIYGDGSILDKSSKQKLTEHAKQTYLFTFEMKIGDAILVPNKRSRKFALGVITSDPYDESEYYIQDRITNRVSDGLNFMPSNYVKRRKVKWVSTINRNEIPNDLSWILSTHQAIIDASSAKKKLMPLIFPFFKYEDNYYLRVFSGKGGDLSMKDWAMIVSQDNEIDTQSIKMEADIHSPGFLTFITPYLPLLHQLINALGLPIAGGTIHYIIKLIVGKTNLKEKGLVQWAQEVHTNYLDNKIKKLDYIKKKLDVKNKTSNQDNNNLTVTEKLELNVPISGNEISDEESKKKKLDHNEKG